MQQVLQYNPVGQIGRWFFQNRSLTPLLSVCLLVVLPAEISWPAPTRAVWLFLILAAEALRVWAVGYAGSATRTRGDTVPELVVAGPYRYIRNPLYVANILMYTAMGLFYGFIWLAVFIFAFSVTQYVFIVAYEEQTLLQLFGEPYLRFTQNVARWLPKLRSPNQSTGHSFKLVRALRSERSTLTAIVVMLAMWEIKQLITG